MMFWLKLIKDFIDMSDESLTLKTFDSPYL